MASQFIRIGQAAQLLGKTPRQLRRMEDNGDLIPHHHTGGQRFYDLAEIEDLARIDRDMRQVVESATVAGATVRSGETRQYPGNQSTREALESIPPPHTHSAGVAYVRWTKELLELEVRRRELIPASSVNRIFNDVLEMLRGSYGEAFCRRMEADWSADYDQLYGYASEQEIAICDLINAWAEREMG